MRKGLFALVLAAVLAIGYGGASLASADGQAAVNFTPPIILPGTPTEVGFIVGPNISVNVAPQGSTLLTATIVGPVIFPPSPIVPPGPIIELNGPFAGN